MVCINLSCNNKLIYQGADKLSDLEKRGINSTVFNKYFTQPRHDKSVFVTERFIKSLFDRTVSLLMLILLVPFFLIIAAFIKVGSKGPVFFMQKRCGLDGREFYMYKFRTMVVNAEELKKGLKNEVEGSVFKVRSDPRVTKTGLFLRKWSIDELPQLINVLKGDMSLVGPRPLESKEMEENLMWRQIRLSVPQGMTGLWQINGRDTCKFDDWIFYDIQYAENWSFWLDLKILFQTIPAVLKKKGAC